MQYKKTTLYDAVQFDKNNREPIALFLGGNPAKMNDAHYESEAFEIHNKYCNYEDWGKSADIVYDISDKPRFSLSFEFVHDSIRPTGNYIKHTNWVVREDGKYKIYTDKEFKKLFKKGGA